RRIDRHCVPRVACRGCEIARQRCDEPALVAGFAVRLEHRWQLRAVDDRLLNEVAGRRHQRSLSGAKSAATRPSMTALSHTEERTDQSHRRGGSETLPRILATHAPSMQNYAVADPSLSAVRRGPATVLRRGRHLRIAARWLRSRRVAGWSLIVNGA